RGLHPCLDAITGAHRGERATAAPFDILAAGRGIVFAAVQREIAAWDGAQAAHHERVSDGVVLAKIYAHLIDLGTGGNGRKIEQGESLDAALRIGPRVRSAAGRT